MSKSNKDYLNGLIAKAKKSWEGVDVESFMSGLRDDTDKEVAEKEQNAIAKNCEAYRNELRRLERLLDESAGVPASLMPVGKSLSEIRWEMVSSKDIVKCKKVMGK